MKKSNQKLSRRQLQLTKRKEKETHRSEYLEQIKANEITDTHRDMMIRTRDMSQGQTMKQLLSAIDEHQHHLGGHLAPLQ